MLEQLNTTSRVLEDALENYIQLCQSMHDLYVDGQSINTIPYDLATSLVNHLPLIQSLRKKLQHTEKVVRRSINASSSLVPIHALPSEILTRIFKLVQGEDCISHSFKKSQKSPILMGTCSYWRQVVLNSPTLWTHIDLPIHLGDCMGSRISHAKAYAERSGQMLLQVHIIDHTRSMSMEHLAACTSFVPFIASIAPRVQSFIFEPHSPRPHSLLLSELFNNCTPGTLKTLIASIGSEQTFHLDRETAPEPRKRTLFVDVPKERLEEVLMGIKVMRLRYLYLNWTSSAYRGLVELRLQSGGSIRDITESQLVGALSQSPGLRILECGIPLASPSREDEQVDPVPLNDLEVVNLVCNVASAVEGIVRCLAPGPKPLQLFLMDSGSVGPHLMQFFARSNITRVYALEYDPGSALHLVRHLPRVQSIALAYWPMGPRGGPKHDLDEAPTAPETIYMLNHRFTGLTALHDVLSLKSLKRVVFHRCNIWDVTAFLSGLSTLNPRASFQIVPNSEPDPVGGWEVLAP